jgi:predicted transcriptional regulator
MREASTQDTLDALFARIEENGLTISEVTRRAGLGFNILYRWRDGSTKAPNLDTINRVRRVLEEVERENSGD